MNGFDFFHENPIPAPALTEAQREGDAQPSIERPAKAKRPDTAVERKKPQVVGVKVPFNPHRSIAVVENPGDD